MYFKINPWRRFIHGPLLHGFIGRFSHIWGSFDFAERMVFSPRSDKYKCDTYKRTFGYLYTALCIAVSLVYFHIYEALLTWKESSFRVS